MRLTKEKHRHLYSAGIRICDLCKKEEFLKRTIQWKFCKSCERIDGLQTGRRTNPPKQIKTKSYINYCNHCKRAFEVASKYLQYGINEQKFCSSKCGGEAQKINICVDCGVNTKKLRCDSCYQTHWHKTRGREKYREKWQTVQFKTSMILRNKIKTTIRRKLKGHKVRIGKIENLIGCSLEKLIEHIENQFLDGMNWSNWTIDGWHLDHIIPVSLVDLADPEQLKIISHYSNLRPIKARDNLRKYNKIIVEDLKLLDQTILEEAKEKIELIRRKLGEETK